MGKKDKKHADEKEMEIEEGCCCHADESDCECGDECCCGGEEFTPPHLIRQFYTKAERITMLEGYLEDLKAELAAVEEEIAELKKE